jgi:hypothetical protein
MPGAVALSIPDDYTHERYSDLARRRIVVSLAGIAAEQRVAGTVDLAGARRDLEGAYETADALAGDEPLALLRDCQSEARRLVDEHWAAIEAVAALLADHAWLDEDDLRRAVAGADGEDEDGDGAGVG